MTTEHNNTALVIGGAGFVGQHLVRRLRTAGVVVAVLDNFARGRVEVLPDDVRVHRGDIAAAGVVEAAVRDERPQVIYHLAANHFIPQCIAEPAETLQVNVVGTQRVLDAVACVPTVRLVFASTADVYTPSDRPHTEADPIGSPNVYGLSKWVGEQLIAQAARRFPAARFLTVRLFNVFGPGETNPHIIPEMVRQVSEQGRFRLGNLEALRDYVHVEDVADVLLALRSYAGGESIFNVGTGVPTSVHDLIAAFAAVLGRVVEVEQDATRMRAAERGRLIADATRARGELQWAPQRSLHDGLRALLQAA